MITKIVTVTVEVERAEVPEVEPRERTEHRKPIPPETIIRYAVLTAIGIALFIVGQKVAYVQRGYRAVGGEIFALLLPVLYSLASRTLRDWMETEA